MILLSSLYEHFNCSSKEELYQKVKKDDVSVRSLVDFIDYSKASIENKHHRISYHEDFITFVTSNKKHEKDEIVSVFCSTKNEPLHVSHFNTNDQSQYKNVLKESLDAGSDSMFYLSNYANTSNIDMQM